MTDKQIIIYKKECYNEPYCSLNKVLEQLSAKEQECEELKDKLDYFEKCNKDLDNYIPAFRMGEFGYIKKSEVENDRT